MSASTGTSVRPGGVAAPALDPAFVAEIRSQLEAEAAAITGHAGFDATLRDAQAARDESEQVAVAAERDVIGLLDARSQATLAAIDAALARIDAGSFGRCEDCGGGIGEARLRALPHAPRCLDCQSRDEHRRH